MLSSVIPHQKIIKKNRRTGLNEETHYNDLAKGKLQLYEHQQECQILVSASVNEHYKCT